MTRGHESNAEEGLERREVAAVPRPMIALDVPRSTVAVTWGWLWKDTLSRVVPLAAAALVYARFYARFAGGPDDAGDAGEGPRRAGLWNAVSAAGWLRELGLGAAVGLPLAGVAAAFRAWVAPGYRLPTPADQAVQTTFYLAVNAPAEELFWRGTVQALAARGLRRLPPLRRAAPFLGWAFATAAYAGYHRLGNWSWRSIAGVAAAGALFGWLYEARPRDRALIAPIVAHGLATAGFLSWGDVVLYRLALRRLERRFGPLRRRKDLEAERQGEPALEEQPAGDE